jgi:hypothetical protein
MSAHHYQELIRAIPSLKSFSRALIRCALALYLSVWFTKMAQAADPACTTGANAFFSLSSGKVCLPVVKVQTPSGSFYYNAQLKGVATTKAIRFALTSTAPVPATGLATPTFSTANGLLTLPVIEQYDVFGTNRYSARLKLLPNTSPAVFELIPSSVVPVISAGYVPGLTWKPYVSLSAHEKDALNLLGYSQPYSALAVAVYDFGINSVGEWDLREISPDFDSGMQAAVYVNRKSNDVALAFRGTEVCFNPFICSVEDAFNDQRADAELTQGHDSGQFADAFNYAQQVVKVYGKKIKVTGHSLGGGLAQAVGASYQLETYAFNAAPVPNNFYDAHGVKQFNTAYAKIIHVISDIHDPISSPNRLSTVYADASYVTPVLVFDFDSREIIPSYQATLSSIRFNKHTMETLRDNIATVMQVYRKGW